MARNGIQFQKGFSLLDFQRLYGTEELCVAALEQARWPACFCCPRCASHDYGIVYGRRLKRYQCRSCRHQATVIAGTILQATKLPLTVWFLAFYLIGQAKTGISSLELSRHLGVNYDTAWQLHNKIMRAMSEREEAYVLLGKIQMDDSYLGGERPAGKPGRGSENKVPIVAAISLNNAGHPIYTKITPVSGLPRRLLPSGPASTLNRVARCSPTDWSACAPLPPLDVVMRQSLAVEGIRRIYPNSAGSIS